jgi:hypothetical protein
MKLKRPLAGYTLRDHKYNDDIRSELGVQSITEILDIYRTNWHDHLLRMELYQYKYIAIGLQAEKCGMTKEEMERTVSEESWRRNGPVGPSLEVIDDDELFLYSSY